MKQNRKNQIASLAAAIGVSLVVLVSATLAQNRAQPRAAFDVVSLRPHDPTALAPGERGGQGARGTQPCSSMGPVVAPGRLAVTRTTTFRLITWAYDPRGCQVALGYITGQPQWTMNDLYDFQATVPAGTPDYGRLRFQNGDAPKLQEMLQTMLEDRFKLKLHRESKEVAVFNLVATRPGRLMASANQTPPPDPYGPRNGIVLGSGGTPPPGVTLMGNGVFQGTSISMSALASGFAARSGRPVIDKTGLKGFFDIKVLLSPDPNPPAPDAGLGRGGAASADPEILDALGLKLEPSRAVIEVLVIDSIEKPAPN